MTVTALAKQGKTASRQLAQLTETTIHTALLAMADALLAHQDVILAANERDRAAATSLSAAMMDRLTLTAGRVQAMADGIRNVAALPSVLYEGHSTRRPNGLQIEKRRVPLGLVGVICEARPNVTADVAALCLKTGNACLLRGGKEAIHSNQAIATILSQAVEQNGIPVGAIGFVADTERTSATEMMQLYGVIDLLIPRGGASLIQTVVQQSKVPVIETGTGNCHIYADAACDVAMAARILTNAKCSRPSVCNAAETLLVHTAVASELLPLIAAQLHPYGVKLRGCPVTRQLLGDTVALATEEDYATEFLDMMLAVRVVADFEEAVRHIEQFSTGHSECIVTNNYETARQFTNRIDAAAVYVNASTRFTDGEEFGLGAEIGISTAKLHARGPMGLAALTCDKYVIFGQGQVR